MSEREILPLERLALCPPALQLAVRGWLELQERGYGDGRTPPFTPDTQAIAAIVENGQEKMIGGVVAFTNDPHLSRLWIDMSYVLPEFRGRGVYRTMWDALVRLAVQSGITTIESATGVSNSAMRAIAKKLHREERMVSLVYQVQP